MILADVRDWLESIYPETTYYVGTVEGAKDNSIGVYQLHRRNEAPTSVGGGTQTARKCVSLLVHWENNATATETAAEALLAAIRINSREQDIGGFTAQYIRSLNNEPIDVGRDAAGVYERVIELEIYYR